MDLERYYTMPSMHLERPNSNGYIALPRFEHVFPQDTFLKSIKDRYVPYSDWVGSSSSDSDSMDRVTKLGINLCLHSGQY
jgi:hypothetical protein